MAEHLLFRVTEDPQLLPADAGDHVFQLDLVNADPRRRLVEGALEGGGSFPICALQEIVERGQHGDGFVAWKGHGLTPACLILAQLAPLVFGPRSGV